MSRTVFEATNENLKEIFLGTAGATDFVLEHLVASHRALPPAGIAHWNYGEHKINYRVIETDLSETDVGGFVDGYARSALRTGWALITE